MTETTASTFLRLLREQVGHEFDAHQQYIAIAVWFDSHDLPQLARHYYRQAVEERNHAMMLVQYMLDRNLEVQIPAGSAVRNDFTDVTDPLRLALAQEQQVTVHIAELFEVARDTRDYLAEQFLHWFLEEQVEEEASMSDLLAVAERTREIPVLLEEYLARETPGEKED